MFGEWAGRRGHGHHDVVVLVAKFAEGAWITALLVVVMIVFMRAVNRHYVRVNREIDLDRPIVPAEVSEPIVVVPIDRWSRISEKALSFALVDVDAIFAAFTCGPATIPTRFAMSGIRTLPRRCARQGRCVPKLVTLKSPYRYILQPIVDYVLSVERESGRMQSVRAGSRTGGAALVGRNVAQPPLRPAEGDAADARQPANYRDQYSVVLSTKIRAISAPSQSKTGTIPKPARLRESRGERIV
jgi:hypothetical protein